MVPEVLWEPTAEGVAEANLMAFVSWLGERHGLAFDGYEELWAWSVAEPERFWRAVCDYFAVRFAVPAAEVLSGREMPGAEWFPGARLSYAEHVFRDKDDDRVALRYASELRPLAEWTWGRLRGETAAIAASLRDLGVEPGDRVAACMPNAPETVAAFLACASIGAIWSSAAPEFGVRSIVDRFQQIEPKVLLAVDGYRYGGRDYDRRDAVAEIAAKLETIERVASFGHLSGTGWEAGFAEQERELEFAELDFGHPLWIVFSSGTTGLPKAIVHSQGGILLEHLKALHFHIDLRPQDRLFWFTTTGWMMWNFLVGGLLTEASILLYDGSPTHPTLEGLWDLASEAGVTCFGTSASFIDSCQRAGVEPRQGRRLSALRAIGSTGSPLSPEGFEWVYRQFERPWLFSASGGTDVCTAFVGGVPTLPVYKGELQARTLGSDIHIWDEDGAEMVGAVGELVITTPMPSMPIAFWCDPRGERLRESYFEPWDGVWRHGDWAELTTRGTVLVYGRSDSTINRGGVRMGTSEIYRSVLADPDVEDALVVDVPRPGTIGWMPLFVVLREQIELDPELIGRLRGRIASDCSPRHVPDDVIAIAEVPRTLSGKILEVPVKRILAGAPVQEAVSRESLANPAALDFFVGFAAAERQPAN